MNLTASRQQIDEIDKQITALLEERMKAVAAVAAYKKAHRMPVLDASREAAVLDKVAALLQISCWFLILSVFIRP